MYRRDREKIKLRAEERERSGGDYQKMMPAES